MPPAEQPLAAGSLVCAWPPVRSGPVRAGAAGSTVVAANVKSNRCSGSPFFSVTLAVSRDGQARCPGSASR